MQDLRYTVSLLKNIQNFNRLVVIKVHLDCFEIDVNTTGMGTLVISVYKRYGAVLFEDAVQLKLFPVTKIKPFE